MTTAERLIKDACEIRRREILAEKAIAHRTQEEVERGLRWSALSPTQRLLLRKLKAGRVALAELEARLRGTGIAPPQWDEDKTCEPEGRRYTELGACGKPKYETRYGQPTKAMLAALKPFEDRLAQVEKLRTATNTAVYSVGLKEAKMLLVGFTAKLAEV